MIFYSAITLLLALSCVALCRAWRRVRAFKDFALLEDDRRGCCHSLGFIGCSVVCSDITEIKQIEKLLQQEYERYEVIIVLDSLLQAETLHEIITRYRMVSVNCAPTLELPATIRHLYRSRQRSYRRLIVVDAPRRSKWDDWNAGVVVASYDYILPISSNMTLYDQAIEHLAVALCTASPYPIDALRSSTSTGIVIARRAVVACGGFSPNFARQIARKAVVTSRTPIIYHTRHTEKIFSSHTAIITILVTFIIVTSAIQDLRIAISIALTVVMIFMAARWVALATRPEKCSIRDILYQLREIVNIFPFRKFQV